MQSTHQEHLAVQRTAANSMGQLTALERTCIELGEPTSGTDWIDERIRERNIRRSTIGIVQQLVGHYGVNVDAGDVVAIIETARRIAATVETWGQE